MTSKKIAALMMENVTLGANTAQLDTEKQTAIESTETTRQQIQATAKKQTMENFNLEKAQKATEQANKNFGVAQDEHRSLEITMTGEKELHQRTKNGLEKELNLAQIKLSNYEKEKKEMEDHVSKLKSDLSTKQDALQQLQANGKSQAEANAKQMKGQTEKITAAQKVVADQITQLASATEALDKAKADLLEVQSQAVKQQSDWKAKQLSDLEAQTQAKLINSKRDAFLVQNKMLTDQIASIKGSPLAQNLVTAQIKEKDTKDNIEALKTRLGENRVASKAL